MSIARPQRHHRTQYTCMDTALKPANGSLANQKGLVFYFVEGRCRSLPCPPYQMITLENYHVQSVLRDKVLLNNYFYSTCCCV